MRSTQVMLRERGDAMRWQPVSIDLARHLTEHVAALAGLTRQPHPLAISLDDFCIRV